MSTKNEDFYTSRVTQSDYRGSGKKTTDDPKAKQLNFVIPKLKITKKAARQLVIDKITLESEKVIRTLLPEDKAKKVIEGPCLKAIFKELGIDK